MVTKEEVFRLYNKGLNQTAIFKLLGCHQSTVSQILVQSAENPKPPNIGGQPKKTSAQDDRCLKILATKNWFNSTSQLSAKWNFSMKEPLSRSTTYWRLWEMEFCSRLLCTKPLLNSKQKKKHHLFARKYKKRTVDNWKNMLFLDESKFVMEFGDQGMWVWHRIHERHSLRCLKWMVKHPASIMVWRYVFSWGIGSLHFLPCGRGYPMTLNDMKSCIQEV